MSEATKARRRYRREEWATQTTLARLLMRYLDPQTVFWTSLENKPSSRLNGLLQKRRGVRSGLPDTMVVYRRRTVFVELKSKAGVASMSPKQVRAELVAAGARWWMARSVRAALTALHSSGVPFQAPWKPPSDLRDWEGPFTGEEKRAPQLRQPVASRQGDDRHQLERPSLLWLANGQVRPIRDGPSQVGRLRRGFVRCRLNTEQRRRSRFRPTT